jgi:GNAT superfamily N-acetyltransferase
MLTATSDGDKKSNIVPSLGDDVVVIPRGDVHYVATEYGTVNLFGKSIQERAMAMITIAHPDFRPQLFDAAKKIGLIGPERKLGEASQGIYPIWMEETIERDGEKIFIRPSKPVDERRIQEHYYHMDRQDILSRFFHDKSSFARSDVENKFQIDYVKDMTFVAVIGEIGFGKVVAVGEYLLLLDDNIAEVAFSVSRAYQGKGLGKILLRKLAAAARENGISGLVAYTAHHNKAMIQLFKTLPYEIKTSYDSEALRLSCRFNQLANS